MPELRKLLSRVFRRHLVSFMSDENKAGDIVAESTHQNIDELAEQNALPQEKHLMSLDDSIDWKYNNQSLTAKYVPPVHTPIYYSNGEGEVSAAFIKELEGDHCVIAQECFNQNLEEMQDWALKNQSEIHHIEGVLYFSPQELPLKYVSLTLNGPRLHREMTRSELVALIRQSQNDQKTSVPVTSDHSSGEELAGWIVHTPSGYKKGPRAILRTQYNVEDPGFWRGGKPPEDATVTRLYTAAPNTETLRQERDALAAHNARLREALEMLFGNNATQSVCRQGDADMMGRVKGTWGEKAEANARAALSEIPDQSLVHIEVAAIEAAHTHALNCFEGPVTGPHAFVLGRIMGHARNILKQAGVKQ